MRCSLSQRIFYSIYMYMYLSLKLSAILIYNINVYIPAEHYSKGTCE